MIMLTRVDILQTERNDSPGLYYYKIFDTIWCVFLIVFWVYVSLRSGYCDFTILYAMVVILDINHHCSWIYPSLFFYFHHTLSDPSLQ